MSFASGCSAGSDASVMFSRNFGRWSAAAAAAALAFDSIVIFISFFLSPVDSVGDAMGVVDVTGVLLCELLVSNDNGDASFAGVSFLSLSLIDCDRTNVLSSQATTLCSSSSSSISVDILSGSAMSKGEREREKFITFPVHSCGGCCCCCCNIVVSLLATSKLNALHSKHLWRPLNLVIENKQQNEKIFGLQQSCKITATLTTATHIE